MGCLNSKPKAVQGNLSRNVTLEKRPSRPNSSRIEDSSRSKDGLERLDGGEAKVKLIDKERYGSNRLYDDQVEKKQENPQVGLMPPTDLGRVQSLVVHPGYGRVPEAAELEQVAAGWPSWLVSVAGEALMGWLPRRASTFEKLEKIGQGTYSSVFKARDLVHKTIVALKKVRCDLNDLESVKFMAREIIILRRLDHPNIIKLEGLITAPASSSLYLVMEYMEHDLVGISSLPGVKFTEPQVKCYMHQLLSGLDHCHSRGILHRDIKGSNLLIDSNGILKIADFGLATFFDPQDDNIPMTSRVVTLWYRPPELLLGASHYGVGVDLWSAGCILGESYGNKPILPGKTEVEQIHKIFKLCGSPSEDYWRKLKLPPSTLFKPVNQYGRRIAETFKDFPAAVLSLIDTLLSIDPDQRGTANTALKSQFFTTEPFACDPSSLPKYPPSKEIDAKMREETRKERVAAERNEKPKVENRGSKEPPALKANASLTTTIQKQFPELKSKSDVFNYEKEDRTSRFPAQAENTKTKDVKKDLGEHPHPRVSHSGPLVKNRNLGRSIYVREHVPPRTVKSGDNPSALSGPTSGRSSSTPNVDRPEKRNPSQAGLNQPGIEKKSYRSDSFSRQVKMHNEPTWDGPSADKIYMSGPLLVQSKKVDQMLEEHDRQLQEYARQTRRNDKARLDKV